MKFNFKLTMFYFLYSSTCLLLLTVDALGSGRSIYWEEIKVVAFLNKNADLRILETQTVRFSGDYNGLERRFRLENNQKLSLVKVNKVLGQEKIVIKRGDLSDIDQYKLIGKNLRIRSRLPTDPPFKNEKITYEIEYILKNILNYDGQYFILNHDFLFPDRDGQIVVSKIYLSFDPVWKTKPIEREVKNLSPGKSYVVTVNIGEGSHLKHLKDKIIKETQPFKKDPIWILYVYVFLLLTIIAILYKRFIKIETQKGRFNELPSQDRIDEAWLKSNVFQYNPEEVGALWDETTKEEELSALFMRLHQEGFIKITKEVEENDYYKNESIIFQKTGDFKKLKPYEVEILDGIFIEERDEITLDEIKKYYKSGKGYFDPIRILSIGLNDRFQSDEVLKDKSLESKFYIQLLGILSLISIPAITALASHRENFFVMLSISAFSLVPFILSTSFIFYSRKVIFKVRLVLRILPIMMFFPVFVSFLYLQFSGKHNFLNMTYFFGFNFLIIYLCYLMAPIRNKKVKLDIRMRLAAAKKYFELELTKNKPNLKDSWCPYLVALGLEDYLNQWNLDQSRLDYDSFDNHDLLNNYGSLDSFSGNSINSSVADFTGGGGLFSGAGASGSWVSEIGTISTSVAVSAIGGGSSGGGGGGGW